MQPVQPSTFPCLVKAVYSFAGESKGDLGFVQGDLIECLNTGDGQWWFGRLKRNKTLGSFPSNYVELVCLPTQLLAYSLGTTDPVQKVPARTPVLHRVTLKIAGARNTRTDQFSLMDTL